jgi:3-oxoacyl-[acyl-carrier-protein] synthase II
VIAQPLVITGVGLVTPLGRSAVDTWRALMDGGRIADHVRVEPAGPSTLPRVASLAVEAATEAVRQAGWGPGEPAAVVACTSKGPVEEWLSPAATSTSDNPGRAVDLARHGYGMSGVSAAVAASLAIGDGPRLTLSAACAGGLQGLVRAAMLIRRGEARRVLVVAAEASVHPLFLASFRRLGVLAPPGELCRPFDLDRAGFLMSEAAAAVCLEADIGPGLGVAVDRFATGGDAASLTGSNPDAPTLGRLLADVARGEPFDLVHAHGTGTPINDAAELAAFAAHLPSGGASATLYSHKGALGHTLGAAGLVAAVLNVLCHAHSTVPPNVNTRRPMATAMRLQSEPVRATITRSLACAAGFGGSVTTVSFASL